MSCQNSPNISSFLKNEPMTFTISSSCQWYNTRIPLVAGQKYLFTADLKQNWNDSNIKTNACGYKPSDLSYFNPSRYALQTADFFKAKRYPGANWFEIIGSICGNSDPKSCQKEDYFRMFNCDNLGQNIGKIRREFVPTKNGILFCFANDNSYFYFNNSGSIDITIQKFKAK